MEQNTDQQTIGSNQAEKKPGGKGGWIAAAVILVVAIGAIVGLEILASNELTKKDQEIAELKKNTNTDDDGEHTEPTVKTERSLAGFDTKIEDALKLLKGENSYLSFKKMIVSKDGEYMFILGGEHVEGGGGGLAQYYRSTSDDGVWKYYAGGNGIPSCKEFNDEQIEIASKYAEELDGLINTCLTDSGLETQKISDL